MRNVSIEQVIRSLAVEYGRPVLKLRHDPMSVLVETILSQNTSDTNSHRAYSSLIGTFNGWEDIAEADVSKIAFSIRAGGLGEIKARRIRDTLREILSRHGKIELDFLDDLPLDEAREWLKHLPGVGTKTANCVLLFSSGRPALPVDTHIFRVTKRLGLLPHGASVEKAHELLAEMVSEKDVFGFHVLVIEHGRKTCRAQRPACLRCVLGGVCPSHDLFVRSNSTVV